MVSESGFDQGMVNRLNQELDQSRVKSRTERGATLSYLEAWDVIDTANDIFGFDGWSSRITDISVVGNLGVRATMEVNVLGVKREDVGFQAFAVQAGKEPDEGRDGNCRKGSGFGLYEAQPENFWAAVRERLVRQRQRRPC